MSGDDDHSEQDRRGALVAEYVLGLLGPGEQRAGGLLLEPTLEVRST